MSPIFSKNLIREFDTGAKRTGGEIDKYRYDLVPHSGLKEIARRFWVGHVLKGYPVDNWRKGIPFSVMINHAIEHLEKLKEALPDEDDLRTPEGEHFKYLEEMLPHLGAIGWFVCCMSEFIQAQREDLDDRVTVIVRKKKESYSNDKTV